MVFLDKGPDLNPIEEAIKTCLRELHHAIESKDIKRLGDLVVPDVFVLGSTADAVAMDRDSFITDVQVLFEQLKDKKIQLHGSHINVGLCSSGRSAWFLDRFVVAGARDQDIPIRLTGLLVQDHGWHLSAASWSIPMRDNDYQVELLATGKIPPGVAMQDRVSLTAQPLAENITKVMSQPTLMPALYSTRPDAFTIGSTVDEVFFGADGKNWVNEIVHLSLKFAVRGGFQSAISPDGCTAWLATNIDLSGGLTVPYRFFYVWLREQDEWNIVLSHDAVCIDPFNAGFDYP